MLISYLYLAVLTMIQNILSFIFENFVNLWLFDNLLVMVGQFYLVYLQWLQEHYKDLKSKPFFPKLIEYITSGPVICMVCFSFLLTLYVPFEFKKTDGDLILSRLGRVLVSWHQHVS